MNKFLEKRSGLQMNLMNDILQHKNNTHVEKTHDPSNVINMFSWCF